MHSTTHSQPQPSPRSLLPRGERPPLAAIQSHAPNPPAQSRLVTWQDWAGTAAERFRLLAARLVLWRDSTPGPARRVLACTSCMQGEGKTVTLANLALTLARATQARVLLIEGDLRQQDDRSGQERLWGLPHLSGLGDWIAARVRADSGAPPSLQPFLHKIGPKDLFLLPAGASISSPLEFLHSEAAQECLASLTSAFDWVLIDAPPLLPLADAQAWNRCADGMLLVVREGWTHRPLLQRALRGSDRSRLVGVLVNSSREAERDCQRWPPARARLPLRLPAAHRP